MKDGPGPHTWCLLEVLQWATEESAHSDMGCEDCSVVKHLSSLCEALGSIPGAEKGQIDKPRMLAYFACTPRTLCSSAGARHPAQIALWRLSSLPLLPGRRTPPHHRTRHSPRREICLVLNISPGRRVTCVTAAASCTSYSARDF